MSGWPPLPPSAWASVRLSPPLTPLWWTRLWVLPSRFRTRLRMRTLAVPARAERTPRVMPASPPRPPVPRAVVSLDAVPVSPDVEIDRALAPELAMLRAAPVALALPVLPESPVAPEWPSPPRAARSEPLSRELFTWLTLALASPESPVLPLFP